MAAAAYLNTQALQGDPVVVDARAALEATKDGAGELYYDYVASRLSAAARHSLEEIMRAGTYEYQSDFARKYFGQGRVEGEAEMILVVLAARGLPVSDEARSRITSCTDLEQLKTWGQRAATVDSIEDLFN